MVDSIYLAALSRHPNENEAAQVRRYLGSFPDSIRVLQDLFWALLNSNEFVLVSLSPLRPYRLPRRQSCEVRSSVSRARNRSDDPMSENTRFVQSDDAAPLDGAPCFHGTRHPGDPVFRLAPGGGAAAQEDQSRAASCYGWEEAPVISTSGT